MNVRYRLREFIDFVLVLLFCVVFQIYFNENIDFPVNLLESIIISISIVGIFIVLGIYRMDWQYINFYHYSSLLVINLITFIIFAIYSFSWFARENFILSMYLGFMSLNFTLYAHRIYWFFYFNPESLRKKIGDTSVIIYGAGTVTMHLLQDLRTGDLIGKYHIVAIIDNNPDKIGSRLGPYKIQNAEQILSLAEKNRVKEIWLTMPVNSIIMDDVFSKLKKISVMYKVVPRRFDHIIPDIRGVRIEDLIQRPEIRLSQKPLEKIFHGKRILITGAAGSIGSEIARQLQPFDVQRLVLVDQNERGIYDLEMEFAGGKNTICLIADIRNKKRIMDIILSEKPHIIFHAAAYKHVPLMEKNFIEAINTNILGTYNLLVCARDYLIRQPNAHDIKLINISTDKAVSPENIMGLTKRISELLVHNLSTTIMHEKVKHRKSDVKNSKVPKQARLKALSVRFGNVLSSSGSVVPLFWEQIQNGGPLTVTHPEMERFFMTVPEAVNLVLHGLLESTDDSILALDMGKPVNILHMAERLILLSGLVPYKDIDINFVGIRPGEKLKEELFWTKNSVKTNNPYIFKSQNDLKILNVDEVVAKIIDAQKDNIPKENGSKKSLHWWKQFLKQFV
ncbi:MAG: polysaccharide biosynthesis protein [Spirochaetia bacterium]|nr:polysaccharide biosynthesis protein [Spirochaetia bacterium]